MGKKRNLDTLILELLYHENMQSRELARRLRLKSMNRFNAVRLDDKLQKLEEKNRVRSYWYDDQKQTSGAVYYMITVEGQKTLRKKKDRGSLAIEVLGYILDGIRIWQ
ncbi:helix-turn-helix transcriptional regulator [Salibacterium halotolerans]|uniref:Transcriptional regulator PadR-like family protein n=1 Tax=Salibacterium halotolerans TaxID=1884432 RepID=A0A1I5PHP8_9BACI|nr:helix-turn-helix transcriptional regulator [Salibacterium halotolerans]SFP33624.1 Transcriptional regulator PadR-like family protein [Salibacterium halotolerans]